VGEYFITRIERLLSSKGIVRFLYMQRNFSIEME
jgi:hypothetical protein